MIFDELSNAFFRFSLRCLEFELVGGRLNAPPPGTAKVAPSTGTARVNPRPDRGGWRNPPPEVYLKWPENRLAQRAEI